MIALRLTYNWLVYSLDHKHKSKGIRFDSQQPFVEDGGGGGGGECAGGIISAKILIKSSTYYLKNISFKLQSSTVYFNVKIPG